jgi:hypothetical protein
MGKILSPSVQTSISGQLELPMLKEVSYIKQMELPREQVYSKRSILDLLRGLPVRQLANTTCYNASDGGASASTTGGTLNYTYQWSNASTSNQIANVPSGTYSVTVTDGNGCTDSSSVFVDVFDNIYPVAIVQNITVFLNQSGFTSIDVLDIDNGSYDNCGIDTMYINLDSFKCSDVGENLVSFTVVDSNSNSVTTSAFVNVLDTTLPLIDNCPSEIFDEASSNCGFTLPDYTLLVNISDSCGIQSIVQSPTTGTVVDTGATAVVIVATDVNGNMDSCNFMLYVHDTELPVISCRSDTTICTSNFTFLTPTATDNCIELSVEQIAGLPSGSSFPVGTTTNTFTATDSAGNQSTCSFTVTRDDSPLQANAGLDTALCELSTTDLNAEEPTIGAGTWSSLGSATIANQNQYNSMVNNLILGLNGQVGDIYSFDRFAEFDIVLLDSMFHFAKKDKEKEIGLIQKIVSDIRNGSLLVVCIQDTGDKVQILNQSIDFEKEYTRVADNKFKYTFEDEESEHKSEMDYRMIAIEK